MEHRTEHFPVRNERSSPIELWLEPAGMVFDVPPGGALEVSCHGPAGGHLEVEQHPEGHLALYAWKGAAFSVLEAGVAVYHEKELPDFPVLPGRTVRQTVESLHGGFEERRRTRRQD